MKKIKNPIGAGILGAAVGAAGAYFLYGTKKGARARKEIVKTANKVKDKAIQGDLISAGKEIYEDMTDLFKEKKDQIKKLDKEDIEGLVERIKERWEETKDDIEETLEEASD
jgi:gas vesicle protein